MKYLTRTIWILSVLSLFTDISTEMLYPIMPLFLQSIGFSVVMMGLLEGMAEATVGMSKGYFGAMSDAKGRRLPFVQLGYFLSGLAKPMMAIWSFPVWIFAARTSDKLGKGIRTAARDAILSDESAPENKGKVFGFHRAMDTFGAALGPTLALVLIYYFPGKYRMMFLIAFIPAMAGLSLTLLMKDKPMEPQPDRKYSFLSVFTYFRDGGPAFRRLTIGVLLFSLFNSSDLFLLMKIKASTHNDQYVIGAYIFYNVIYALASFPLGAMGDKFGLKRTYILGLILFAGVYTLMGLGNTMAFFIPAFLLYGLFSAATEGISKALVTTIVPRSETASAVGSLAGLTSLMALASSTLTGLLWNYINGETALLISAGGAVIAAVYLSFVKPGKESVKTVA
ncbi:MAG: transporter [Bacteroidetes bacterium]|nr:transporter [Bacteroidota bacterium]